MRDTWRLRQRLVLLACIPVLGAACNDPPPPRSAAKEGAKAPAKVAEAKAEKTSAKSPADKKKAGPRINEAPPPPPIPTDPTERRLMPRPGDPPYIDGYNPEEEPCPSGNWCGNVETALAIAPHPNAVPKEMDCPTRIVGSHQDKEIKGPKYAGLSTKNNMQGSLNQHGTELKRGGGNADACCYHWFEYCSGRPLVEDGKATTAATVEGGAWLSDGVLPEAMPAAEVREALVQAWLADAAAEHASVASFARVVLELMAVGAPADLVRATIEAGHDEVGHAQACYAIASRIGERDFGPGPLPAVSPREPTLARVAVDAFVEGCVGETIAALVAERAAGRAGDRAVAEVLRNAAEDEGRHAAVAWRTLHWAVKAGGEPVETAVRAAADTVLSVPPEAPVTPEHPDWATFGRLSAAEHRDAVLDARREIIGPMLERLLA